MLWWTAEIWLQDGICRSTKALLVAHAQQRGQRNRYRPGKRRSTLDGKTLLARHFIIVTEGTCKTETLREINRQMAHRSNICLMTRKPRAMGKVAQRSRVLGKTLPSWSFKSSQPWPSGNQIQSAHICSLSQDNILQTEGREAEGLFA